ncbi:MAG: aminoglycoside phosphotransferase family protein [Acidobacteriota bacterium]
MTNQDFRNDLPAGFVKNTIALCGERGEKWLDELPTILAELGEKWGVEPGRHFKNLSYNYVANAAMSNGKSAVIKIGLPLEDVEIFGETAYLKAVNGEGAVQLLGSDRERQAILLERVVPGSNLKSFFKKDQAAATGVAIGVLKRVLRPVGEDVADLVSLDGWFDGMRRYPGTNFPHDYAEKALSFYEELSQDKANVLLIPGDLHHSNILTAKREPFLLIDPKGMVGHAGYDMGVFLNNHRDWLDWDTRLEGKLDQAVIEFSAAFDLTDTAVRKWAFCQMVLSWWWIFDEMPELFAEGSGLSDIWNV